MRLTDDLIESYFARTGQPKAHRLDAAYAYQWELLRDLMKRLEVILEDEDSVTPEAATRVLRALLYGAPSAADAELRMRQQDEMVKLLGENRQPITWTDPVSTPDSLQPWNFSPRAKREDRRHR